MLSVSEIYTHLFLGLFAPSAEWIGQGFSRLDQVDNKTDMMHSMLWGSVLLISVQIVLVLVAVLWYRRSSKTKHSATTEKPSSL